MPEKLEVDNLVIGAGFFGLFGADVAARHGQQVLVVEMDEQPLQRASFVNQARLHLGYHYPRSLRTATRSARYYYEFIEDFGDCINTSFEKIYAIARDFSYTNPDQFESFCSAAQIPCHSVPLNGLFDPNHVQAAFETREHSFDAAKLRNKMLDRLTKHEKRVELRFGCRPLKAEKIGQGYTVELSTGEVVLAKRVFNSTYASTNQLNRMFGIAPLDIKYELCEVALCEVPVRLRDVGITLMDGPFFSLMPFGFSGLHSLTSVTFTPHKTTMSKLPTFDCQSLNPKCSPEVLDNCNFCQWQPKTSWEAMSRLALRYLDSSIELSHKQSLYGVKAVLQGAEVDDARPTVITQSVPNASFTSVLSGKINTVYDLLEGLNDFCER